MNAAAMHEVTPEEIMALQDGELPADRAAAVSRHIGECATCKEIHRPIHATSAALATWVAPTLHGNPQFESRLFDVARFAAQTHAANLSSDLRRVFRLRPSYAWAGAALGVLVMIVVLGSSRQGVIKEAPHSQSTAVDLARANAVSGNFDRDSNGTFRGTLGKLQNDDATLQQAEREGSYRSWTQNGPMIARTVSLSIIVKDFSGARAALDTILARHHGYAANLSVNTEQSAARTLQASLRVPAPELAPVVAELKSLGPVQDERQNGKEVTQQHADLVARLRNSRETETRLQEILRNRTGKISDVLAVEQEVSRVRGEIEQMEAERTNLEHRVDFATVDLSLSEEYKAQLGTPAPSISTRFHNALVKGIRSAQEMVVDIALFCAEVGPSLVIWLVMLLPVGWFFWRCWRRGYSLASSASV